MVEPVRSRSDFAALSRSRRRGRSGPIWVAHVPAGSGPRVAYAIGRPVGSAVVRNRLRRRLRAIVRSIEPVLPAGLYLIGARPDANRADAATLRAHLERAVEAVA